MKTLIRSIVAVTILCLSTAALGLMAPSEATAQEPETADDGAEAEETSTGSYGKKRQARHIRHIPSQHHYRYPFTDHRGFFRVAPSLGALTAFGDVSIGDASAEVSATPVDTAENYDLLTGLAIEAGYGRVGLEADFQYFDLLTDETDNGELGLQKFISNIKAKWTYEPLDNLEIGPTAGIRHIWLNTELTAGLNRTEAQLTDRRSWLDPVVGLHGRYTVADRFLLTYFGDVGGIGFGSDITWQAYGAVGATTGCIDFELGYRHLYVDFADQEFEYEMNTGGPIFTTRFRF